MQKRKNILRLLSFSALCTTIPSMTAHAAEHTINSPQYITILIITLLKVFRGAGILLLVYSIFSIILAIKNEDVESKVNATSQFAVALMLISFGTIAAEFANLFGITLA